MVATKINSTMADKGHLGDPQPQENDLAAQMQALRIRGDLDALQEVPSPEQAIVHLKILHNFYALRIRKGQTDGLFDLYDRDVLRARLADTDAEKQKCLDKLQEKRWAVYVARAVQRFTAWWNALKQKQGASPITIQHILNSGSNAKRLDLQMSDQQRRTIVIASKDELPPLDVLMVWHSFMLNPRCYLEDCMRQGLMTMWFRGFPWNAIESSINVETGEYEPGEKAELNFVAMTGCDWESSNEMARLGCPACFSRGTTTEVSIPFSTCGKSIRTFSESRILTATKQWDASVEDLLTMGAGYADADFSSRCPTCGSRIDHDSLVACRFVRDSMPLAYQPKNEKKIDLAALSHSSPLPGTVLDKDGLPLDVNAGRGVYEDPSLFPNRLLSAIYACSGMENRFPWQSMTNVKTLVEGGLASPNLLKYAQHGARMSRRSPNTFDSRVAVRRMMSRYWNNSSDFALDLVGAVIRQGTFIDKMQDIDWLHSPAIYETMTRLITKYTRFVEIMGRNTNRLVVPTLDVDLAWHTHQLSPKCYFDYTTVHTAKFIDHDDKISEVKLNDAFAETSRLYQDLYNEPYSQCTCWYCESIRASHTSSVSRLFDKSTQREITARLHDPDNPSTDDPQKGPHISAHNAIRPTLDKADVYDRLLKNSMKKLDINFERAARRAKKDGRPIPRREQTRNANTDYGNPGYIPYYAPFVYYPYVCPPVTPGFYGCNPACASYATGSYGACAAGSCGGAVASGGSCGGGGACGAGGAACAGGACGGGGGGGGGCGGGGGGGGGGCGGGGGGGG